MIPTIKTSPTLFAALTATALLVFQPSPASARTTLQLDNGNVLSFSDGSIDMVTGSGELFDVSVVEYGEEIARAAGSQVMELLKLNLRPRDICTKAAFENAARVVAATGGSTNAALHLPAMASEAGIGIEPRLDIGSNVAGAGDFLKLDQLLQRAIAGGVLAPFLEHIDHGHIIAIVCAGQDRAAVNKDRRHI